MFDGLMNLLSGGKSGGYRDANRLMRDSIQGGVNDANRYYGDAMRYLDPYYSTALGEMGDYQNRYKEMMDPSYINKLMGGYEQSPWAKIMTQRGIDAAEAAAGRAGSRGSTNYLNQISDYSANTAKADMQNWLQNVLGARQAGMGHQANLLGLVGQAPYMKSNMAMTHGSNLMNMRTNPRLLDLLAGGALGQSKANANGIGQLIGMVGGGLLGIPGPAGAALGGLLGGLF